MRSYLKEKKKKERKKEKENLKPAITNLFSHWLRKQRELKSQGPNGLKEANKSKRGTGDRVELDV